MLKFTDNANYLGLCHKAWQVFFIGETELMIWVNAEDGSTGSANGDNESVYEYAAYALHDYWSQISSSLKLKAKNVFNVVQHAPLNVSTQQRISNTQLLDDRNFIKKLLPSFQCHFVVFPVYPNLALLYSRWKFCFVKIVIPKHYFK
jgi:hypothetical protein